MKLLLFSHTAITLRIFLVTEASRTRASLRASLPFIQDVVGGTTYIVISFGEKNTLFTGTAISCVLFWHSGNKLFDILKITLSYKELFQDLSMEVSEKAKRFQSRQLRLFEPFFQNILNIIPCSWAFHILITQLLKHSNIALG